MEYLSSEVLPFLYTESAVKWMDAFCLLGAVGIMLKLLWETYNSKLPPGPWGLPIIGASFRFGSNLHEDLTEMAKKYGDIFSLKLGNRQVVVLNGSDAIREAMINNAIAFAGRPDFHTFAVGNKDGHTISLANYSPHLRLVRKIAQSAIHKFVYKNGDVLEGKLKKECERLIPHFRAKQRIPFDPKVSLRASTANVILGALFGVDRDYDNEDLRQILHISDDFRKTIGSGTAVDFMPWLSIFPNAQLAKLRHLIEVTKVWMGHLMRANKRCYTPGKIRSIADSFVKVMEEETLKRRSAKTNNNVSPSFVEASDEEATYRGRFKDHNSSDENESDKDKDNKDDNRNEAHAESLKPLLSDSALEGVLSDLFGAGFDTTHISLHWALAYLIKYPSIQRDIQRELDNVIGRERLPTSQDMGRLPLLEATVYEILRVTSIAPLALPHSTLTDTKLAGYEIPQGTVVFMNLWSLHRSEKYWEEPDVFNPYRFIDEHGCLRDAKSLPGFLPFGSGRRQCPGRALAFVEIFAFLAALLHQFRFSQDELDSKYQGINLQGQVGLTLSPETFYVHLEAR